MTEAPFDWMERPLRDRLMALYDSEANEVRDTIGQAIDELDKRGWRPISSAPKDGTAILIWQPDREKGLNQDDNRYAIGYWRVAEGGWGNRNSAEVNPTHWMPLPPPPTEGEKE